MQIQTPSGQDINHIIKAINLYCDIDGYATYLYHPIDYVIMSYNNCENKYKTKEHWESFAVQQYKFNYLPMLENNNIVIKNDFAFDVINILTTCTKNIEANKIIKICSSITEPQLPQWTSFKFYSKKFFSKLKKDIDKNVHWAYLRK